MKVRTGFVSNSSSASFIVGIAIIDDITKFTDWIKTNGINVNYSRLSEIDNSFIQRRNDYVYIESFNGATASVSLSHILNSERSKDKIAKALLTDGDNPYIAWFDDSGDDPEWNEAEGEYNYDDIDLSWFDNNNNRLYSAFTKLENGVLIGDVIWGGGRDG